MTQPISTAFSIASAYVPLQQGAKQAKEEAAQAKLVDEIFKAIPLFCIPTLAGMIAGYVADPFSIKDSKELLSIFSPGMIENWLANSDKSVTLYPKEVAGFIEVTKIIQLKLGNSEKITSRHLSQLCMRKCAPNSEASSQYQVAGTQFTSCFALQNLRRLTLELNQGQTLESLLEPFRACPIEELKLSSPTGFSIAEIAHHKSLAKLTLDYKFVLDLSPLSNCSQLKTLTIYGCFSPDQMLLPKDCLSLKTLTLGRPVTDAHINNLSLPNLTRLIVKGIEITNVAIAVLGANFPKLETIELTGAGITDSAITYLDTHPTLKKIELFNCRNLSNERIAALEDSSKFEIFG